MHLGLEKSLGFRLRVRRRLSTSATTCAAIPFVDNVTYSSYSLNRIKQFGGAGLGIGRCGHCRQPH
jgi:hypothetical protein